MICGDHVPCVWEVGVNANGFYRGLYQCTRDNPFDGGQLLETGSYVLCWVEDQ